MSLEKNLNGFHQFILNRDELLFNAIAVEFKLDAKAVRAAAYTAEDNCKPKPIKPQARRPKKEATGEKQKRKISGFLTFTKSKREEAKTLLINNPKERKIRNKKGEIEELVFEAKHVVDGVIKPDFTHVNKKCTAMWWALSDEEREQWVEKAKTETLKAAAETETTETTENSETAEDTEESEKKATPEKAKIPPKKGKGEGRNPAPKAQVPAKKQAPAKAAPAPKNTKTTAQPATKKAAQPATKKTVNTKKPQNKKASQSSEAESSDQ